MTVCFSSRGVGSVGLLALLLLVQQARPGESFLVPQQGHDASIHLHEAKGSDDDGYEKRSSSTSLPYYGTTTRRNLLHSLGALATIPLASASISPLPVQAVVLDNNNTNNNNLSAEKIGKLTLDQARQRFRDGYASLTYLLDHFDEICNGGGDNVRRYLGTVGFTSGLVGMEKTLKVLETSDSVDDIVEYTELSQELIRCIQQADGSSYMAIFVTTSPLQVPPSKYFNDAKIEIKRAQQAMQSLAKMIDVDLTVTTTATTASTA